MAENENVLEPEQTSEQPAPKPSKGKKGGKVKEWFRKKAVALKRRPQNIALLFLAVATIYFMLTLYRISIAVFEVYEQKGLNTTIGICVFVTTLLSLLVLVSFLNSFPKRKKPNIFFIVLVFLMIGAMIACDIVYYVQMTGIMNLEDYQQGTEEAMAILAKIQAGQRYIIGHVALLGVSAVVFALLPAYRLLINKINTKVELESATEKMHGDIDIQED